MNPGPGRTTAIHARRNVRLYPWYRASADALAWLPIFFLYFSERVGLGDVLALESIYYVAVVSLEVPSGYFSDRTGRRVTLLIAAAAMATAYLVFLAADSFALLAFGQLCVATGVAFESGTDTVLHYDSLVTLGAEDEFAAREARAERFSLTAGALAALAGGAAGSVDLRLAYVLSLAGALVTLAVVLRFAEPPGRGPVGTGFVSQLRACAGQLGDPLLAWLCGFYVLMFALAHVPYEFYQPYLMLLAERRWLVPSAAPAWSGALFACTMLVGAWAAGYSARWSARAGLVRFLLGIALLQLALVTALALALHPVVLLLVLLRNVPMAATAAPINAAIAPRVPSARRATYLSMQSLAGRLGFAVVMLGLSQLAGDHAMDWSALSAMLRWCAVLGIGAIAVLTRFRYRPDAPGH